MAVIGKFLDVTVPANAREAIGLGDIDPNSVGWDIIPVPGQSNALGRGLGMNADYLDGPDSRVYQFANLSSPYPDQVVTAKDPLFHQELPGSTVGFALTFAKRYASLIPVNRRVLLVPCAHGDTGFAGSGTYTWRVGATGATYNLYDLAVAQINKALALPGENRVVAVLWHQGEANNATSAASYRADLLAVIDDMRVRYGADLPFILGQMSPARIAASAGYATIDGVHREIPTLRDRVGMWLAAPLYNSPVDDVHFSADGQRVNGLTAFKAYALALGEGGVATRDPLPAPAQVTGLTAPVATDTAVSLTWPAVPRTVKYKRRYRIVGAGSWSSISDVVANLTSITGLTPGTNYEFQIAAEGPDAIGEYSASVAKATPALPVPGFADTFTRADGPLGVAESGQAWTIEGSGSGNTSHIWNVESNRARMVQGQANMFAWIDALAANGTLTQVIGAVGAGHVGGMLLHYQDSANYLQLAWRNTASSFRYYLTKRVGGNPSAISGGTSAAGVESEDGAVIEVVLAGTSITVKENGSTVIGPLTVTEFAAVTRHGMWASNADNTGSVESMKFEPAA